ncbi:hypothetical protein J4Q44_G00309350, partial [Coregonus suidteri]
RPGVILGSIHRPGVSLGSIHRPGVSLGSIHRPGVWSVFVCVSSHSGPVSVSSSSDTDDSLSSAINEPSSFIVTNGRSLLGLTNGVLSLLPVANGDS